MLVLSTEPLENRRLLSSDLPAARRSSAFMVSQLSNTVAESSALTFPKNVRMTTHHLCMNGVGYVVDRELSTFLSDLSVEDNLEKQIAKLIT
jgi:hypothetical protein